MKKLIMFLLFGISLNVYSNDAVPSLTRKNLEKELIRRNVPCYEIVVAQALHESGNFKSRICREKNNIFGMRTKKGYKKYESWIDCVDDYVNKFSKRYKGGDYFKFLIKVHYHEDPLYEVRVRKHLKKVDTVQLKVNNFLIYEFIV